MKLLITLALIAVVAFSAVPDMNCSTCPSGQFYNGTSGACEAITAANCQVAELSAGRYNGAKCASCSEGYWLNNGSCTQSSATNCRVYASATTCSVCASGYVLGSDNLCFSLPTDCTAVAAIASTDAANAQCTACVSGKSVVSGACTGTIANPDSANCKSWFSASACSECKDYTTHYLSAGTCTARTVTVTGCGTYSQVSDVCLSCSAANNFISGTACAAATGVANCQTYSSATTCGLCNAGYQINAAATSCTEVASTETYYDANCHQYLNNECQMCLFSTDSTTQTTYPRYANTESDAKCAQSCPSSSGSSSASILKAITLSALMIVALALL